ncbi:MAG: T9SS type A sorting domain-containing protein [Bacteroidetes bacterium]|nr:T9SS type A sorting domain-containing protein [Bacteroidota bacterium]
MDKNYLKLICVALSCLLASAGYAQTSNWNNPDSAKNVSKPAVPWSVTNPIGNNHDTMTHTPYNAALNDSTDFLYMYDFGFNVPANANIDGVEMIIARGACNAGSYFLDTVSLAYNGMAIGNGVVDSAGPASDIDTLGGANDLWYNTLTPAIVNSRAFGVFYSARSVGICTFGLFDCKLRIHYSIPSGIAGMATSATIAIYPNPVSTDIVLSGGEMPAGTSYYILNAIGQVVGRGVTTGTDTKIDVHTLPAGIYTLRAGATVARFMKK